MSNGKNTHNSLPNDDCLFNDSSKVEYLLAHIKAARNNSDFIASEQYALQGIELTKRIGDLPHELDFRYECAVAHFYRGFYDETLRELKHAINIAEEHTIESKKAPLYNLFAVVSTVLEDFDQALSYYQKSLEIREKNKDEWGIIASLNNISETYYNMKNKKKSLEILLETYELVKKTEYTDMQITILNNMAWLYWELEMPEKSFEIYSEILHRITASSYPTLYVRAMLSVADYYFYYKNDISTSKKYLLQGLLVAKDIEDVLLQKKCYQTAYPIYKASKQFKIALEYHEKLLATQESIHEKQRKSLEERLTKEQMKLSVERDKSVYMKNLELMDVKRKLESRNEALLKIAESKDYILSIVAHDLRNSIGSLLSCLSMLQETYTFEPALITKCIEMMDKAAHQSIILVEDILQMHQLENENITLDLQPLNLFLFWQKNADIFTLKAQKKDITLNATFTDSMLTFKADENRMFQIVDNILSNAVKFTPRGGVITIEAEREGNYCKIVVQDTGIGIDNDKLDTLFTPFTQARRKGTEGEPTTGLGLSIVKRLVELHKGTIDVKSVVNNGSILTLHFPLE